MSERGYSGLAEIPTRSGTLAGQVEGHLDVPRGAPTLLIVGGRDVQVLELNRRAYDRLGVEKGLEIVPGCGHLFEEAGALQQAAGLAAEWFARHLVRQEAGALAI